MKFKTSNVGLVHGQQKSLMDLNFSYFAVRTTNIICNTSVIHYSYDRFSC